MLFAPLANVFEKLEKTSSSNQAQLILAELFNKVKKQDIDKVCYLTLGSIASPSECVVLGMADQMVIKSIARAAGKDEHILKNDFKSLGDLGKVAEKDVTQKRAQLSVADVFSGLHDIASSSGTGSQSMKIETLASLLQRATSTEAKYIVRIALGKLRMGVADMTLLNSLAIAFMHDKKNKEHLERAYNVCPDIGVIARAAVQGVGAVQKVLPLIGRPIKVMLAQRSKTLAEIVERMPDGICAEEKYDGERVQIHKKGKKVWLFSRRMDNITLQFPDVAAAIVKLRGDFIVEGEIVAVTDGKLLDFQTLMQRRRKHDVEHYSKKIPVAVFLFDVLYYTQSYLHEPLLKRQAALKKIVGRETKQLIYARHIFTKNADDIEDFFLQCLKRGTEGIVAKHVTGTYQAGTRGYNWIKWKKDYMKNMRDTFDLVIVGAFFGKGSRAGSYGAVLCACYNTKKDVFETFCKLGSGFTENQLNELPKLLRKHTTAKPVHVVVHKNMKPDIWFEPKIVVEVTGAEITRSPLHSCAEKNGVGLALRFPRLLRFRNDKKAEQATTTKEIEGMV